MFLESHSQWQHEYVPLTRKLQSYLSDANPNLRIDWFSFCTENTVFHRNKNASEPSHPPETIYLRSSTPTWIRPWSDRVNDSKSPWTAHCFVKNGHWRPILEEYFLSLSGQTRRTYLVPAPSRVRANSKEHWIQPFTIRTDNIPIVDSVLECVQ